MSSPTEEIRSHRSRQEKARRNRSADNREIRRPARPSSSVSQTEESIPDVLAAAVSEPAVMQAPPAKRRGGVFRWIILVLQLILFAITIAAIWQLKERTQQATFEVRYLVPGRDDIVESVFFGDSAALHEPVELENYTFLYWEDSEGKPEDRAEFPVYRDTLYTARYALSFESEKHIPYLSTDEAGVLDIEGPVTVREFVNILYTLLDTDLVGKGKFLDVDKEDACYKAAATLKDLGGLEGTRLHPDENLSRGDLLKLLSKFFPASDEPCVFMDMTENDAYYPYFCTAVAQGWIASGKLVRANAVTEVTRGDFARIMNHVLKRDATRHLKDTDVGTILDVPPTSDYYDDVVEAVISHEYRMENGVEVWTKSEALPLHDPGFFFAGCKLHYIDENGAPAANTTMLGLDFNKNGEVTIGDPELDKRLWANLEETIDPDTMEPEEMLRAVYDYVVKNFTYRYGKMIEYGEEGWAAREATRMLDNGAGNCYCFASLFYELARFVGYDAKIYSGRVYGEQYEFRDEEGDPVYSPQGYTPHGWVEIEFDGIPYIFDTEYEYRSGGYLQMFKRGEHARAQFGYLKAPPEE